MTAWVDDTKFQFIARSDGVWLIINLQKFGAIHFEPDDINPHTFANLRDAYSMCLKIQNGEI
jgi:hypothetical protein